MTGGPWRVDVVMMEREEDGGGGQWAVPSAGVSS